MTDSPAPARDARPIRSAELLAVGSELTTGETRDSNGGELAASLAAAGVVVRRITALPDRLDLVVAAFREALAAVDLVVSTGGLGPTPDDLTREALAEAVGETPAVDPGQEAWLRDLFARRGAALPEVNLKQAWLIPSATAIPNENGTAPGWWVDRPDGRVAVLLPGPPREMRPMWEGWVLPRLATRGMGDGRLVRTLRTYGIGESALVERLGEPLFRAPNPVVATYAGQEWLDIRITAVDDVDATGAIIRPAAAILADAETGLRRQLPGYVRAEGRTSWGELVAAAAAARGVSFATVESGTNGALAALLADVDAAAASVVRRPGAGMGADARGALPDAGSLRAAALAAAGDAGVPLGLAVAAAPGAARTVVRAVVAWRDDPDGGIGGAADEPVLDLELFTRGTHGRLRAAVAAAAYLVDRLGGRDGLPPGPRP